MHEIDQNAQSRDRLDNDWLTMCLFSSMNEGVLFVAIRRKANGIISRNIQMRCDPHKVIHEVSSYFDGVDNAISKERKVTETYLMHDLMFGRIIGSTNMCS